MAVSPIGKVGDGRAARALARDAAKVLAAIGEMGARGVYHSGNQIRERVKMNGVRFKSATAYLVDAGDACEKPIVVGGAEGIGYALAS